MSTPYLISGTTPQFGALDLTKVLNKQVGWITF